MPARRSLIALAAVVALAAAAAGVAWWLAGDAPEPVDVERAAQQEAPSGQDMSAANSEEDAGAVDMDASQLTGTWRVDTSRAFDRAAGTGTFVGYRVEEELVSIGASMAVGRTSDVVGEVVIDGTHVPQARVRADLTTLQSDDSRRDNRVRSMLGPAAHAEFVLDDVIAPVDTPLLGEVIEIRVAGMLTIRDVTHPVTVSLEAVLTERALVVTGSTQIELEEFEVFVPPAASVLSASDVATLEWQLYLHRS